MWIAISKSALLNVHGFEVPTSSFIAQMSRRGLSENIRFIYHRYQGGGPVIHCHDTAEMIVNEISGTGGWIAPDNVLAIEVPSDWTFGFQKFYRNGQTHNFPYVGT